MKTFQARYFFIPSKRLNELVAGALAYAQEQHSLKICAVSFLSNHAHLLIQPDSANQVAGFFRLAKSQIAQEVQRLCGWTGGIWDERSTITPISNEPSAQIARLKYVLSQGVKEGLVPHPAKWPGIQSATALATGSMQIQGKWVRRAELYEHARTANRRKRAVKRVWFKKKKFRAFVDDVTLHLSPLPCWSHHEQSEISKHTKALNRAIVAENQDKVRRVSKEYRKRLMNKDLFTYRPHATKKGVQPLIHSASKEAWIEHIKNWEAWQTQFDRAAARLRLGIAAALSEFPEGAFIPTGIALRFKGPKPAPT